MCGRYTLRARLNQLLQLYRVNSSLNWEPRYNIAPSQQVMAIRNQPDGRNREAVLLRWGLIPPWADDPRIGYKMINARAETIAEKPSFKHALKRRRCLIITDGYYEWRKEGTTKQPYFIHMSDESLFVFAGLWEHWKKEDPPIDSCTIITTSPNELMAPLHNRMPVILPPDSAETWLDPDIEGPELLTTLLQPYPEDTLEAYPVSTLVNSPKHESSDCVEPLDD
ncbi:MAG: SOS response-associated peptidase [Planctomycetaceae bacterium]|nr:SOS response-associated peptidase [Planctomycetaceae bacterium]